MRPPGRPVGRGNGRPDRVAVDQGGHQPTIHHVREAGIIARLGLKGADDRLAIGVPIALNLEPVRIGRPTAIAGGLRPDILEGGPGRRCGHAPHAAVLCSLLRQISPRLLYSGLVFASIRPYNGANEDSQHAQSWRRHLMTTHPPALTELPAWQALTAHYATIKDRHLRALFADDAQRGTRLTAEAAGLYFDYSKHRITDETLRLLLQLAAESGLADRITAMF